MGKTICICEGSDNLLTFTTTRSGAVLDISTAFCYFAVKRDDVTALQVFQRDNDAGAGVTITDGPNGVWTVQIPNAVTQGIDEGDDLVYEAVVRLDPAGVDDRSCVTRGKFQIKPQRVIIP